MNSFSMDIYCLRMSRINSSERWRKKSQQKERDGGDKEHIKFARTHAEVVRARVDIIKKCLHTKKQRDKKLDASC